MSKTTNNVQNMLTSYGAFDCADLKQRLLGCTGWTDLRNETTAVLHHRYPSSIANPYLSSCGHIHLSSSWATRGFGAHKWETAPTSNPSLLFP